MRVNVETAVKPEPELKAGVIVQYFSVYYMVIRCSPQQQKRKGHLAFLNLMSGKYYTFASDLGINLKNHAEIIGKANEINVTI